MRKTLSGFIVTAVLLVLSAVPTQAQVKQRVRFARGASSTTVSGTVRGFAYRDYVVGASAGQTISVRLRSTARPGVFTVFLPDGDNLEGATEMDSFTGELPESGDYVIRVGMMRAEARRRGSVSNYSVKISIR